VPRPERFNSLVSKVYREARRRDKQAEVSKLREQDRATKAKTAMVQIQRDALAATQALLPAPTAPARILNEPETCYICKTSFHEVHFFYHLLCPTCASYNYQMRHLSADLTGRVALVTGGRVKIGHQTVLRLLRDGARVIVTTRFPNAAAKRLHAEPDSANWMHRVSIYGLDLRNLPGVEAFAAHLIETEPHLDIIIHNAAQTIRRPQGFYQDLIAHEQRPMEFLPPEARSIVKQDAAPDATALLTDGTAGLVAPKDVMTVDTFVDNEERLDSRNTNSWMLRLDEVSAPEMLEVQLINNIAPFLLNSRLKAHMMKSPFERRFIVNVSAMEGQFSRHKTVFHPHTNMAKAALNMMTRTSGEDYAKDGIFMTSVDTGWVTDEKPTQARERDQRENGFFAPLDIIDGMARIYHPVAQGVIDPAKPFFGVFLKDYAPCPW
jgi:NAD(P)-dependent dehydrogenase (short-subunit alcohol dehydrogenase family)